MADKELSFEIKITGVSQQDMEMSKLTLQMKNLSKELRDLEKVALKGIASPEQLARHAALTKELDRTKKELGEVKKGLDIGGVGTYWTKLGDTIKDNLKSFISTGAVLGTIVGIIYKVGEAFKNTTAGLKAFNIVGEMSKQVLYDIATGAGLSAQRMMEAAKAGAALAKQRQEDILESVQFKKLESEVADLYYKSADATLSAAERSEYLTKAREKEAEFNKVRIKDLQDEVDLLFEIGERRPDDLKLQQEIANKLNEIEDIRTDRNRRLMSQETKAREDQMKAEQERAEKIKAWFAEIDQMNLENEAKRKEASESLIQLLEQEKGAVNDVIDSMQTYIDKEIEKYNAKRQIDSETLQWNQGVQDTNERIIEESMRVSDAETENFLVNQEIKQQAAVSSLYVLSDVMGRQTKAGKAFAVAAATMDTWGAANKTLNDPTIPSTFARIAMMVSVILTGLANVANIVRVPTGYATGGRITSGVHISTGGKDDTLIMANKSETVLTDRHVAMLGGSGTMRRIGVPGYENGGWVGGSAPEIPSMGFDMKELARLMNSIEVKLDVNKLNDAQKELTIIDTANRI